MNREIKEKIKSNLLSQMVQRNYNNYVFMGYYIAAKMELAEQIVNKYYDNQNIDLAADILNDFLEVRCLPEFKITRTIDDYRRSVRALVRGLWSGEFDLFTFTDDMQLSINRNLTEAWNEGANECGIQSDELTQAEINARQDFINNQFQYLPGFGQSIVENNRESGGLLGPHLERANLWINRYNEARTQGAAMACADDKRVWTVGPTEHCRSCAGFNGRVYRFSVWLNNNALPQGVNLCCKGFRCQCALNPTDDRITPGRFPKSLLC